MMDISAITRHYFKCPSFIEVFENDVNRRILGMVEANDKIKLDDLANECRKLGIKCDSCRSQQKSGEHKYIIWISSGNVPRNASSLPVIL